MSSTVVTETASGYRVMNPATGQLIESFPHASDAEIAEALASAQEAYESWRLVPVADRAKAAGRVGLLFAERAHDLASIITLEMGKPLAESLDEIQFCADIFNYYAAEGPGLARTREIPATGGTALVESLPVGPLLGIMPWNYPYYQVARFVAPNLVLGNTILLKHANICPRSALAIAGLMADAGVPAGVYTNIFATHGQVADVIADPRIQGVSLTGSERAGAVVGGLAGANLKKAVLELGGSDAYIVLDSSDVQADARLAWATRTENTGQACNSNKRMIIMADIFDEFVAELTSLASNLVPADPAAGTPGTYGPLSTRESAEYLAAQVQDAVAKGALLHAGGQLGESPGAYYAPAVLTGVTPGMRAFREELFGPVAVVYSVDSDEEALALANDSDYGLGGSVFSADPGRALKVAARLDSGMAHVNIPSAERAGLPFGGVKRSGFGRELGPLGMDEFTNKRLLFVAD